MTLLEPSELTGGTRQADYTIDAKTGELTSKAAVANTSANEGSITFTYTPRTVNGVAGTAHTFTINLSVSRWPKLNAFRHQG